MVVEKGVLVSAATVVGVAFVGLVGYKIVKKKKPELLEKAKKPFRNIKKRTSEIVASAKQSFREGYAQA